LVALVFHANQADSRHLNPLDAISVALGNEIEVNFMRSGPSALNRWTIRMFKGNREGLSIFKQFAN
jgi:hypothetical protein